MPVRALLLLAVAACFGAPAGAIVVHPGTYAPERLREALDLAQPGEAVELAAGVFRLDSALLIGIEGTILRGAGRDRSILSFHPDTEDNSGLRIQANGVRVEGFAIQNATGPAVQVRGCTDLLVRNLRLQWRSDNGQPASYLSALEILDSQDVLVEKVQGRGAGAAGLLVRNSTRVLVRDSEFSDNRIGVRLEESNRVDIRGNSLGGNGTGVLMLDLPGGQMLQRVRIFDNQIVDNNNFSFAANRELNSGGNGIPLGSGVMVLGARDVEIFNNRIANQGTFNLLIGAAGESFPDRIYVHNNTMGRSGYAPDLELAETMIRAGGGRLGSIVWDGRAPLPEVLGLRSRAGRLVLGNNTGADFVDLDLPWFEIAPALHSPNRNPLDYAGTLPALPPIRFASANIRSLSRE